jgi:hypothetical protein
VALGGNRDRSGHVDGKKIETTVLEDFGMTIDLESLYRDLSLDPSGNFDFASFKALLS